MDNYWSEYSNNYNSSTRTASVKKSVTNKIIDSKRTNMDPQNALDNLDTKEETINNYNTFTKLSLNDLYESMKTTGTYKTVPESELESSALNTITSKLNESDSKDAPYSYLADENGTINYNGVTYVCDPQNNAICLGDMSKKEDVLTIPLSGGGSLKVNRNNIDDLAKSIGMFSPEDTNRIMDALSLDAKVKKTQNEIEDQESKVGETITEKK